MDTAEFTGAPRTLTLAGAPYRISPLRLSEWGIVQQWIKENVPSPMAALADPAVIRLPERVRRELHSVAIHEQRNWPPRVGSPAWFQALNAPGGSAAFLRAAIARHRPEFTAAEAEALSEALGPDDVVPVVAAAMGWPDDPKSPA